VKEGIVVIGAGGHAKVVISTLMAAGYSVDSVLDDNPTKWGSEIMGYKIQGPISRLEEYKPAVIAIGDNKTRQAIALKMSHLSWVTVVHPHSYVHPSVKIGLGTVVFAGAVIQPDTIIGRHSIINTGVTIDHDCHIGDFVHLAPGVNLAGDVSIGEGSFLGLGSGVIMGKSVGAWSIIGAGGMVISHIPPHSKATGVPAKVKIEGEIEI